jgi:hypothetical protein
MYQKRILPYFIIPSTVSPQAYSLLERYGRTEKSQHLRKAVQLHYAHLYKGLWQRQHGRQQIRRFKAGETATGNEESCIDIGVVSL